MPYETLVKPNYPDVTFEQARDRLVRQASMQDMRTRYMAFLTENGLDPTVFPSLLQFENDLAAMARAHLGDSLLAVYPVVVDSLQHEVLSLRGAFLAAEQHSASLHHGVPQVPGFRRRQCV